MSKRELREKVRELERRVAELEARPMSVTILPSVFPSAAPQIYPQGPMWKSPTIIPSPVVTCGPRKWIADEVQAAYDHDGLRS